MIENKELVPHKPLKTAVLFLVFNRLDTTKQVFEAIRQAKPPRLYIAADGAREEKEGEAEKVQAVRDYILSNIDWKCVVKTLFREQNNGCKIAVSSAITWFFENEDMGIILEDDCLPSQSFFSFCDELLFKYNDNDKIFMISGDGRATKNIQIEKDYDFIKYPMIWGWATWKRTWEKYDVKINDWCENKDNFLDLITSNKATKRYWELAFQNSYEGKIDTWDYQFVYSLLKNKGLCIVPALNMITNIGFGIDATHTKLSDSKNANIKRHEILFPINHPNEIKMNEVLNSYYDLNEFKVDSFITRILNRIKSYLIFKSEYHE